MKIVVGLRTRNEHINIARFCKSYDWVDKILVADGRSEDDTVSIAETFSNVEVRNFVPIIKMENKVVRNPHGLHLNYLIDWAFQEENADWLIMDDCDCFPNKSVKEDSRKILEETIRQFVYITRLYLWKNEGHFPKLSQPHGKKRGYIPSLWAIRKDSNFHFKSSNIKNHQEFAFIPTEEQILKLLPPYALLHCPWQTDEMVEQKLNFYRDSGEVPNMLHPLEFGGDVEPLPAWAVLD